MTVRCPVCGANVALAVGETRLSCAACGLVAPLSHVGTAPGAMLALETDLTGRKIAGRELVERIGAGGMGTVYRGRADRTDDVTGDVAVKVLRPGLGAERAAMLVRFAREAEAMRRLAHARVVRYLEHGEDGDIAYIVTELVEGRDLAQRLAAGRMAIGEIVTVFGQVCEGVAAAHAAGIVHRDLKPANILVGATGVKVADFGLAQLGADVAVPTLTRTDVAMGTFHYLAPEQRKDARNVDHRADVWALGVILYEMLTGELPLGSFAPAGGKRADAIVRKALAPDPAQRYQSVTALGRDVRALVAPRRASRSLLAVAATLVLAGTGAVAFAVTNTAPEPQAIDAAVLAVIPPDATTPDAPRLAPLDPALVAALGPAILDAGRVAAKPRPVVVATGKKPESASKIKAPTKIVPQVCRTARACCTVVKGGSCGAWLAADADACGDALADFQARTTNIKQRRVCGLR